MRARIESHDDHLLPPRARCVVGGATGIVTDLLHYLPDRSDPAIYYSTAVETDLEPVAGVKAGSLESGGTGLHLHESAVRAVGEAVERYCLHFPDRSNLREASHRELVDDSRPVVDFEYLAVYEPAQLERAGLVPLTREANLRWQPALDLFSGTEVYVPAQLVWMGGIGGSAPVYFPTTSSGCACGTSPEMALLGALSECAERDAIMRAWYTRRGVRGALPMDAPRLVPKRRRLETDVLSMRPFAVESAIDVPVVVCAAVDSRDRAPRLALGGACAIDPEQAAVGAMLEAAQTYVFLKELIAEGDADDSIDPSSIFDLRGNLLYYSRPENYDAVSWFLGNGAVEERGAEVQERGVAARLRQFLRSYREAGLTPLVVDATTRGLQELGYTVVRVVVPELVDLTLPSLPASRHPALEGRIVTTDPHPYP